MVPRYQRGTTRSNFGVFGKGKRVFYVDPEIAHHFLDLAMAEQNLNLPQVACSPVDCPSSKHLAQIWWLGDGEAKTNLRGSEAKPELLSAPGMTRTDIRHAMRTVKAQQAMLPERWNEIHE